MFLDEMPPDTSAYLIAGYAAFFLIGAVYLASLFFRNRNLNRDLTTLNEVQKEGQPPAPEPRPARPRPRPARSKAKASSRKAAQKKTAKRK